MRGRGSFGRFMSVPERPAVARTPAGRLLPYAPPGFRTEPRTSRTGTGEWSSTNRAT